MGTKLVPGGIATVGAKPPDLFANEQMPQFLTPHEALRWLLSSPKIQNVTFANLRGFAQRLGHVVECRVDLADGVRGCAQVGPTPEEAAYLVYRWLEAQRVL